MICNSYWAQVLAWAEELLANDLVLIPISRELAPKQLKEDLLTAARQMCPTSVPIEIGFRTQHSYARVYYRK
jgi:hypothetical protein